MCMYASVYVSVCICQMPAQLRRLFTIIMMHYDRMTIKMIRWKILLRSLEQKDAEHNALCDVAIHHILQGSRFNLTDYDIVSCGFSC